MSETAEPVPATDDALDRANTPGQPPPVVYVVARILVSTAMEELGVVAPANDNR